MEFDQFKTCVIGEIEANFPSAFLDGRGRSGSTSAQDSQRFQTSSANHYLEHEVENSDSEVRSVQDLLELTDHAFIRRCYQVLLKREPDAIGYQSNLEGLRSGKLSKLKIVRRLMRSEEGKRANVQLKGVGRARLVNALRRVPLVGSWIAYTDALKQLPKLQRRVDALETQLADAGSLAQKTEGPKTFVSSEDYDQFYLEFENLFRGSRETVRSRHEVYLPIIEELVSTLGPKPILDVACGRGEWLELLSEREYLAEGVDINTASLAECAARGLVTHQSDAFDFLESVDDDTYLAVTSFHLIEHLPLDAMLHLIDEIKRVLVPGGKMILETPNPANLIVGSHTFFMDPTHEKPLPPSMMQFVVQQRGFKDATVRPLHPHGESGLIGGFEGAELVNDLLFGCQDYAVIGTKK